MIFLIDTHALIYYIKGNKKLPGEEFRCQAKKIFLMLAIFLAMVIAIPVTSYEKFPECLNWSDDYPFNEGIPIDCITELIADIYSFYFVPCTFFYWLTYESCNPKITIKK